MCLGVLPLLRRVVKGDPEISCCDNVCRPRRIERLDLVPGVQERRYFAQLFPIVRPNHKHLPKPKLLLQFILEVVVFQDDRQHLKAVLTIDDPKFVVFDLRLVPLSWPGGEPYWHDAHRLPVPLYIVHQIVNLPLHAFALVRPHHPLVWWFLHLKQSTLKVKWRPMGQQSFEYALNSRSTCVAFTASRFSPFFKRVDIIGAVHCSYSDCRILHLVL